MKTALVIGGSGLVGSHLIRTLAASGDWAIVSTQRRVPALQPSTHRIVGLELATDASAGPALQSVDGTTHLFFLARAWRKGYVIDRDANVDALARVLDEVQDWPLLEHVQLVHGLKWYGSTLGPFKTPASETDPVADVSHFYNAQREMLITRQRGRRWHWSTLRPHCVSGVATGSPSNVMLGMGVYAALSRELGRPLSFPGSDAAFCARLTYTSAELLAEAMRWTAVMPQTRNEDFNVANGDCFSWQEVWPNLAASFGVAAAPPQARALTREMPALADAWRALSQREGLAVQELGPLVDWDFMDATLALAWDQTMSVEKLHRLGFCKTVQTPAMIHNILETYRQQRILPRL